ncbi:hypothetical protein CJI97_003050 [Candidozyma auris]|uniref:hypothetical_protein n=1 Tax=Candidozyma auris TaxID=498019 RepID=UPI000C5C8ECC|nr:hypothetical_protein [[Candida] auris]PIS53382.1 hypothetical protein CJI97_003050 [[Candida] auris]QEO20019.1 hypothetical_protein [[Candida] auris]GBL50000.1 hypothetical protein CAJCM15448_22740 [[Candida] auris]
MSLQNDSSLQNDLLRQKLHIKEWEKAFAKANGRNPSKDDVKANPEIYKAYKSYNHLKSKQKRAQSEPLKQRDDRVTNKISENHLDAIDFVPLPVELNEESKENADESHPRSNAELGPTPQANGKVLSLFDFLSPPESSPSKNIASKVPKTLNSSPLKDGAIFKTPTKAVRRIEYSDLTPAFNSSTKKSLTAALQQAQSPLKHGQTLHVTQTQRVNEETPFYLGKVNNKFSFRDEPESPLQTNSASKSKHTTMLPQTPIKFELENSKFSISPSPIKLERMSSLGNNRKLTDVFNEAVSLQLDESLKLEVESELMLEMQKEIAEEGEKQDDNIGASTFGKKRKRITQKRTTRRWKIKPREEDGEVESFEGKNVHDEIKKIKEKEMRMLMGHHEGESEDDDSTDCDTSEPEVVTTKPSLHAGESSKKSRTFKPISGNFQRLKINDPRSKRFKSRMRRR